ncbi:MAG TPA: tetratricopeptide repeat protein, partial [Longimicrobiaceae bacterium]|nr:tetratricopeptide repeat protein [Longimicrobiaceae bacterium]
RVVDVRTGDRFPLDPVTGANTNAVAQALASEFQSRAVGFLQATSCGEAVMAEEFQRALAVCDSALAVNPRSSTALYGKAVALASTNAFEAALAAYQKVLELDPMNDRALQGAGLAASHLGRADLAASFYERYLELIGADASARLQLAAQVAQAGDYLTAYDIVQPVVDEERANPEFQKFLLLVSTAAGTTVKNDSSVEAARPYFQTALNAYNAVYADTVQKDLDAYRQGIAIYGALGNTAQALELARTATVQFDTSAVAWSQYAAALDDAGNYPEEIQALTRLIQLAPDFENAYLRRGLAYIKTGQQAEALADLQQAANRGNTENVAKVLYSTGAKALQAQDYATAAQLLAPAFQYAPASLKSDIGYYLGFALVQQGTADAKANRNSKALQEFQQAITALQASQNENAPQLLQYAQQYAAALSQ